MNLLSYQFFIFFITFFALYYLIPSKFRYIIIFIGSYFFYGFCHPTMIITLMGVTFISYIGGLVIDRKKSKYAFIIFFTLTVFVLVVFKYTYFLVTNIKRIQELFGFNVSLDINWKIVLPVGLSFIVFQACAYLSDVYRGRISAEYNFIRYAAYSAFFPTILSGPIQKARNLLPQIKDPKNFDFEQSQKGIILFIWGAFEKLLVSNNLNVIVTRILDNYKFYSSAELLLGAIGFSLYIYADFNSYSDMARGIAKLLNIDVGKNFNNPYLSISTNEFWNRWHMSLNEWFIENVYIPLGGNRKGTLRKYFNILFVFLISGLWHGAQWHFVVWGAINGLIVIIGQIIKPLKHKLYLKVGISEELESVILFKRIIVFSLITFTWMFFHSGVRDALEICKNIVFFDYISIFNPELLTICGTYVSTFVTVFMSILFCVVQIMRQQETLIYNRFKRQPLLFQGFVTAVLICFCIFAAFNVDANVDSNFLYYDF